MGLICVSVSGRTGRAGTSGRATSFWTDRDSFLVSQIKKAISELESGNTFAFATGKAARQKEKEAAQVHIVLCAYVRHSCYRSS